MASVDTQPTPAPGGLPARAGAGGWPFVGRAAELEQFVAAYGDSDLSGLVVVGAAGVGKTRFADECRRRAEREGATTYRVVGTHTAASVPLGPLAHLVPADYRPPELQGSGPEIVALIARFITRLSAPGQHGPRPVLVADDAPRLDPLSLVVIGELVAAGTVFVVATARSTDPVPDGVSALWRSGRALRLDLRTLTQDQVDALLHLALGRPVEAATARAFWTYSEGNVLVLHELVLDALDRGVLVESDGVSRLIGPLLGSHRAASVVGARLAGLDGPAREVLELLSVADELDLADLEARVAPDALEQLEHQGLLSVNEDEQGTTVRLSHPLYTEAIAAELSTLRLRRLRRTAIELLESRERPRRSEQVRIVSLRVDNREPADPATLRRAAVLARHVNDHTTVERLARLAHEGEPTALSGRLLGEALFELGRFNESLQVLEQTMLQPAAPDERYDLAFAAANTLFLGLGRGAQAAALLAGLAADPALADRRAEIEARRAGMAVWAGRLAEATATIAAAPPTADPAVALELANAQQATELVQGRVTRALELADAAYAEHLRHTDLIAWTPPSMHQLNAVWALAELSRQDEARRRLERLYADAAAPGMAGPRRWFALELGRLELNAGRLVSCERWFREAATTAYEAPQPRAERLAHAGLAMAAGQRGNAAAAADAIAALDAAAGGGDELADTEWERGRAWAEAATGNISRALALLNAAALKARATGRPLFERRLLHTAVRLGAAPAVAGRLRELAAVIDTPLAALTARQATAIERDDVDGLETAAGELAARGYPLLAAEAFAQAAEAARRRGDPRRATALANRSAEWAEECEQAATPALVRSGDVVPLSPREREIAALVARGATNRQIGDRLFLSVRTVENHLANVFMKLGVSRRTEVAKALGLDRQRD